MKEGSESRKSRRLDFVDHRREYRANRYVYPVVSRRSQGLSIGINLNPDKVCNFDCPYCQVDRSIPSMVQEVDLKVLQAELDTMLAMASNDGFWAQPPFDTVAADLRVVRDIAFSGDGEPTSSVLFEQAIDVVVSLREKHELEGLNLVLITNASLFHKPAVSAALDRFSEVGGVVWAKLDAGSEPYFQKVCGTSLPFSLILRNIRERAVEHPVVLQCMFLRYEGEAPGDIEREAWTARLREILGAGGQIDDVQIYTVARDPADPACGPLEAELLEEFADAARSLGLTAEVYP